MFHQLFVREVVVNYNWNYSKRVSSGPSHQRHRQQHWKACRLRGMCIETMGSVDNMDYTMWIRTRKDVGRYWWMLCKESRVVPKAKETTFKSADAPQGWQPTSTFGNQLRKRPQERLPDATALLGVLNAAVLTMGWTHASISMSGVLRSSLLLENSFIYCPRLRTRYRARDHSS